MLEASAFPLTNSEPTRWERHMKKAFCFEARTVPLVVAALMLTACTSETIRNPVPLTVQHEAEVVNMPKVRSWGDEHSKSFHDDLVESIKNEKEGLFPRGPDNSLQYASLALSGGGDHGAFGAGYLKGWSESGTRPTFKIVTGISTGALIAPLAMLGHEYDDLLQEAYTTVTADNIFRQKSFVSMYWNESLTDNHPLQDLVHEVLTDEVIDAVAEAHRNGQRLYIGTTHFDAQRPMIWNMGAIANSPHPGAYEIFRDVLIASAAIPIFFPPVYVDVTVNGETYDEMHVDGGTVGQMFFYSGTLDWENVIREASGREEPLDRRRRRNSWNRITGRTRFRFSRGCFPSINFPLLLKVTFPSPFG